MLKEGHEVRYFIDDAQEKRHRRRLRAQDRRLGEGRRLGRRDRLRRHARPGREGAGAAQRRARRWSAARAYTDRLEDDRSFGQEELKKAGVNIIPYREFDDFDDGDRATSRRTRRATSSSRRGEAQNVKRRLFVGEEDDGEDVVRMLEAYKQAFADEIKVFQLQKRVTGVEVAVGRVLQRQASSSTPINVNFEHKKLFPGNLGPSTGEMGTSMFWSEPNRIFNQTLKKMEPTLAEEGYVGYIDLNCIVNGNGIYPLEFTSRFGYPTIFIQQEGMITPIGQFLARPRRAAPTRSCKVEERLPGRRADRRAALPVRRRRDLRVVLARTRVIVFKKGDARGSPHRGRQACRTASGWWPAPRASC